MDPVEFLKENKFGIDVCLRCKLCTTTEALEVGNGEVRPMCPAFEYYLFPSYSGGGKIQMMKALLRGAIKWDEGVADVAYSCTTCDACSFGCYNFFINDESPVHIVDLVEAVREELVNQGLGPLGRHAENAESVFEKHNPYHKSHDERLNWLDGEKPPEKGDVLFFVGCTDAYSQQQIAKDTLEVLQKMGEKPAVLPDEWCCGSYLLRLGYKDRAVDLAKHNAKAFRDAGAKRIVVQCPGCYRTLKKDYPKLGVEIGAEILHLSEYLAEKAEQGKLKAKKDGVVVTYHDPCHLGRATGVYEQPRDVIKALGISVEEMPRNRKRGWCCGAGGGVKSGDPDFALQTASERIKEAEATGTDTIVTSCPFCQRNLEDAVAEIGSKIKVKDLSNLVNQKV